MGGLGNILWIIIGGAIIGVIARLLLPGKQNIPWWSVILAGIAGMLVGDWLSQLLGVEDTSGIDWIRHGLQLAVGAAAVAGVGTVLGKRSSAP